MKEELEALGFSLVKKYKNLMQYEFYIDKDRLLWVCLDGNVFVEDYNEESVYLFDYNIHKLKILIELLK